MDESLYQEALKTVREAGWARISKLQQTFRIGYVYAAKIVERMQSEGIVSCEFSQGDETGYGYKVIES